MLIVDLDELHFGELFEVCHQRTRNRVQRPIRLTLTREINMNNTIGISNFAVTSKPIQDKCKSLIALNVAWTLEVFIKYCAN